MSSHGDKEQPWTETSAAMTRREIEDARGHLKAWFPNQSVERHTFNKLCDQAVRALAVFHGAATDCTCDLREGLHAPSCPGYARDAGEEPKSLCEANLAAPSHPERKAAAWRERNEGGLPSSKAPTDRDVLMRFQRWTITLDEKGAGEFWNDIEWLYRAPSSATRLNNELESLLVTAVALFEGQGDCTEVGTDAWTWLQHSMQALMDAERLHPIGEAPKSFVCRNAGDEGLLCTSPCGDPKCSATPDGTGVA